MMLRFTARKQSPNFIELALCGIQNFKFSLGWAGAAAAQVAAA
jgi:hypothetical protein